MAEGEKAPPVGTWAPPDALGTPPVAPATAQSTAFTKPPAAADSAAPRNTWPAWPAAIATRDDIVLPNAAVQDSASASADGYIAGSDRSGLVESVATGAADALGLEDQSDDESPGGRNGSPMLARRLFKQGSLLDTAGVAGVALFWCIGACAPVHAYGCKIMAVHCSKSF